MSDKITGLITFKVELERTDKAKSYENIFAYADEIDYKLPSTEKFKVVKSQFYAVKDEY